MTHQLELQLIQRKAPTRQRPVVERLLQLVQRAGVETDRAARKGRIMFRPQLARPFGSYDDCCSNWACQNRWGGIVYSYGQRAETKRQGGAA